MHPIISLLLLNRKFSPCSVTETVLLLECENFIFYKTVLGDAWRLPNLRCTFCIFNSSCANDWQRSTSMQPVYRCSLGTHLRGITVCGLRVCLHSWMSFVVYLHTSAFWLHPVFDLLMNINYSNCQKFTVPRGLPVHIVIASPHIP